MHHWRGCISQGIAAKLRWKVSIAKCIVWPGAVLVTEQDVYMTVTIVTMSTSNMLAM